MSDCVKIFTNYVILSLHQNFAQIRSSVEDANKLVRRPATDLKLMQNAIFKITKLIFVSDCVKIFTNNEIYHNFQGLRN